MLRGVEFCWPEIQRTLSNQTAYLLYPTKEARDCNEVMLGATDTVIVLDGTWDEAQKILYRNPMLKFLPSLSFSNAPRSSYRIRKQPEARYLSTLESVAELLSQNALTYGLHRSVESYQSLRQAFTSMVEQQLVHVPIREQAA